MHNSNNEADEPSGKASKFFSIDLDQFSKIADLNEAVAYLIMARGSGRDQSTTFWSREAIETYGRMSRTTATKAMDGLVAKGLIRRSGGSRTRPRWEIIRGKIGACRDVYLASGIVDGIDGMKSPLCKIRENGDPALIHLLVNLYACHDLSDHSGLPWRERNGIRAVYNKKVFSKRGNYILHSFAAHPQIEWSIDAPFYHKGFYYLFVMLQDLGLVEFVPHVVDRPNGEIIHELDDRVAAAARAAVEEMVTDDMLKRAELYEWVLPIRDGIPDATVVGICRLVFRAQTSLDRKAWHVIRERAEEATVELKIMTSRYRKVDGELSRTW